MPIFILVIALLLGFTPSISWAAPTVANAQREVDRLRTLAAEKYEAANEATIRIKQLEQQTAVLENKESALRKELDAAGLTLSRIAVSQYTDSGLGKGLDLLFSSDPAQYLADAGALDMVTRKYAQQLREFAVKKQNVEATQLVVADRTSLLRAERVKLNRQVAAAKEDLAKAQRILNNLKKEDRDRLAKLEADRENKIFSESKKYAQSYKGDNTRGSIALKYALAQIGDVYVWAAAGPTRWDCSGLTMRSFQKAGVSLPHSSRIQIKYGKNISASSLKPGDLLFFGKPISHVSMYMGGGKMVQAPRPGKKVEVVNFTKMFGKKPFVGARRL
jgi:cell wall-associated NlpC family hydrolase